MLSHVANEGQRCPAAGRRMVMPPFTTLFLILVGRHLGDWLGRRAGLLGGLVLIGIGSGVLTEHLGIW